MSFDKQYCFVPVCDGCGPACWETEPAPHYASEPEARRGLAARYGWRITEPAPGRFEMVCVRCADRKDCGTDGHDPKIAEVDHGSEQQARWEQNHPFPIVMCRRCGEVLHQDAPPAGHPDSTTNDLSDDDEATIAELDRLGWSADADTSPAALNLHPINDYTYLGDES
jgi:hypothetical protein